MKKTDLKLRKKELDAVMPRFNVGHILFARPCGGTANASTILTTRAGQFFLKRRNPRYASPQQLAYDHAVLRELRRQGLPVPKIVRTVTGSRWVEYENRIYELYRVIEQGATVELLNEQQIAAAGEMLARFHLATENTTIPDDKSFGRFWDPKKARTMLEPFIERAKSGNIGTLEDMDATAATGLLEALERETLAIENEVPDENYDALPHAIIHGDWHPANLKFDGEEVVGIFDFDWVNWQPRMVDVADGLLYICGIRPQNSGAGDIWHLTATSELSMQRVRQFLAAYAHQCPPAAAEIAALPSLMAARWIYSRVDAADRKVRSEDQIRFILRDVMAPLKWLRENRGELTKNGW